jgi:integrase
MNRGSGWLTVGHRKKGDVWVHHFYVTRDSDGKRVETTRTIGMVSKFPKESDVWQEIQRSQQAGATGRLTVKALADAYRLSELPFKSRSTQDLHAHELDRYILPRWESTHVDEVRVLEVKKWLIAIAKENDFTAESVLKTKHVFSRLFAFGCENELIAANLNPVKACNIKGVGRKSNHKQIVVPPEIAWKIAISLPIMHRTLVLLAAGTGMRMSELLGLKWGDIDFANRKIMLNQTWVYGRIENGKTEESREPVVVGERTAEFLQEWRSQTPYAGKKDWVFASSKLKGKRPISGSQFTKDHIRPRFLEHGLIDADYTGRAGLHAFRHSLATVLIVEENVDPKTAQGILRHTDAGLTMNIYAHSQDPAKRAALERFESRLVQ